MRPADFLLILFIFSSCHCFSQEGFKYRRAISGVEERGWFALGLTSDVLEKLNADLSDIRLYSLDGNDTLELPYLLKVYANEISQSVFQLPVINKSVRDGLLYLTFELRSGQKVNSIDLEFAEPDFFAFATLEGSADRKQWFEIARDQRIVSIKSAAGEYKLTAINFPVTNYRFLRIQVRSDTSLSFRRATFHDVQVKPGRFKNIPVTWKDSTNNKTRQSVITIKLNGYQPASSLEVEIENTGDYYRSFELAYLTDSAKTDKGWIKYYQAAYEGYLTSFKVNRFAFDWQCARELRLTIRNLDNAPLSIKNVSIEGPVIELLSLLKPGENMMLYGHAGLSRAVYDLAYFVNQIPDPLKEASLGPAQAINIPAESGGPLFESKVWLWGIMGLMMGGLGFFTIKMMRGKP